jgi:hypothetical protein
MSKAKKEARKARMLMNSNLEKIIAFKLTEDNWYPSYRLEGYHEGAKDCDMVCVSLIEFPNLAGFRVSVWGDDDDGMEFNLMSNVYPELSWDVLAHRAKEMFNLVIRGKYVNKSDLKQLGFIRA